MSDHQTRQTAESENSQVQDYFEMVTREICQEVRRRNELLAQPRQLGLLAWGRKYLPQHFRLRPSKMHVWLSQQLDVLGNERGAKINVIGPRGSAKSTLGSLCYVLRAAMEGREKYIWLVSDTKDQAHTHLENVKAEIVSNRRLAREYPHACGRGSPWRGETIQLRNGVVIEAYGTGQRIRGRRRFTRRPMLIVCDDLENDSHIVSASQRAKSRQWFEGTLLKSGTMETNVINLATALHRDALAMRLERTPGWTSARFQAIVTWPERMELWSEWERMYCDADKKYARREAWRFYAKHRREMIAGAELLWPEAENLYDLMKMRVEEGRTAFEREKQSSPIDPARCEWPEDYFDQSIWFTEWPDELQLKTIALDPSKGSDSRHGDYSALIVLGVDREGLLYVEADLARRPTSQMIADGATLCQRHRVDAFGVEANQYQELLAGELQAEFQRRSAKCPPPCAIHNYVNKQVRIRRLGPYLSQRRFRFLDNIATQLLVDQLRDFPLGSHDDGPDALEMALRLAGQLYHGRSDDGLGDRLPIGV